MGKFLIKIFILVAATVVTSCVPKLKVHKVFFDESAGFYKYERKGNRIALRKENGELLFRDDLKGFLNELSYKNMRYNFDMNQSKLNQTDFLYKKYQNGKYTFHLLAKRY